MLVPILEEIVRWDRSQIRELFESHGFLIQEWTKVNTDWLTIRTAGGSSNTASVAATH
jgi:hypothetical protein